MTDEQFKALLKELKEIRHRLDLIGSDLGVFFEPIFNEPKYQQVIKERLEFHKDMDG